jgi:fluoroacetyl-CoA thioesterase
MKHIFRKGDTKVYRRIIEPGDQAIFQGNLLHAVCSTFALARDFEWSSRLFFIEMKEDDEEGVGTSLQIDHRSPAFVGEEIVITATVEDAGGREFICSIEARANGRIVATGRTGQKMLKKDKLTEIFKKPNSLELN